MPPFLIWFAVVCIVTAFIMFSISMLPLGLGPLCREIIASLILVMVFALTISILHLIATFNGVSNVGSPLQLKNLLAWWAAEEVCRGICMDWDDDERATA